MKCPFPFPFTDDATLYLSFSLLLSLSLNRTPTVQTSVPSNTYVINGNAETKKLEELLPGILTQLGEESMDYLRAFAERSGAMGAMGGAAATMPDDEDDDDQVPELVENFEEAASK
jgi:nascent polypeptide-associated complex subunit beta